MITPDNKDFFYICSGHLGDRNFATPDADELAAVEKRRKEEEMLKEVELVKKEFEDKQKKKAQKRKEKDKKKDKKEEKEEKQKEKEEDDKDEKDKDDRLKTLATKQEDAAKDEGPRIFSLQKNFYQMRIDRIRNAELAKRNRDRLSNPSSFPAVPKGDL